MRSLILLIVALLAAPTVAAEPELWAQQVEVQGQIHQVGSLLGLSLIDHRDASLLHGLSIDAADAAGYRFTTDGAQASPGICTPATGDIPCKGVGSQTSTEPQRERMPSSGSMRDFEARLAQVQDHFQVHAFPLGDAHLAATMLDAVHYVQSDACLGLKGIRGETIDDCSGFDAGRAQLSEVPMGDHATVTNTSAGAQVVLVGDFILELRGVSLFIPGTGQTWASGDTEGSAGTYERSILRIVVQGGRLSVTYGAGLLESEWVLEDSVTTAMDSSITLHEARGHLDLGVGTDLTGSTERLHGDFIFTTDAAEKGLGVGLREAAASAQAPEVLAKGAFVWIAAVGALVAAVVAVGLLMRRRVTMAHVERALEAGKYGRAARLSQRLLRKDPFQESAHLSRAIAWTRGGRPTLVVSAVEAFLTQHEPRDGALHYVLGLAYHDLGRTDAAKDAMEQAARRTPSLIHEMAPALQPAPVSEGYS